jgi:hypothetical protein
MAKSAEAQLTEFLSKFTPEIAAQAEECLSKMRARLPGASQLVYDNYNALAIGFGPSDKTSLAIFSIAVFPRWVSLFFLQGAGLADPNKILKGSGNVARHVVLKSPDDLDLPAIQELMALALKKAKEPIDQAKKGELIIKSVSARQRPRRPAST